MDDERETLGIRTTTRSGGRAGWKDRRESIVKEDHKIHREKDASAAQGLYQRPMWAGTVLSAHGDTRRCLGEDLYRHAKEGRAPAMMTILPSACPWACYGVRLEEFVARFTLQVRTAALVFRETTA